MSNKNSCIKQKKRLHFFKILCILFLPIVSLYKLKKMKKSILFAAIICFSITAVAQARSASAEFQKIMQPAVEIEVPFPEKTVMKSIVDMLEKKGYKGKDTKGYYTFKSVVLPELGTNAYDLYFKTDRKSRREKDITTLTLLVSGGYEKFIGDTTDAVLMTNAKAFLNKQIDASAAFDLEMQINDQDEAARNAQKKLTSLIEDGQNLQKKKEKLENEIQENIKKQADQKAETEKQNQIFSTLKGKRKQ